MGPSLVCDVFVEERSSVCAEGLFKCVCVVPVVEGAAAAVVGVDVCVYKESFFMSVSPKTKGPTKKPQCMQEIPTLGMLEECVCV